MCFPVNVFRTLFGGILSGECLWVLKLFLNCFTKFWVQMFLKSQFKKQEREDYN